MIANNPNDEYYDEDDWDGLGMPPDMKDVDLYDDEEYKTQFKRKSGKFLQIPLDKAKVINRVSKGEWVTSSNHFLEILICYRFFEGDRDRLNDLNPRIFPLFDDYESVIWKAIKKAQDSKIKVAKPHLIFFTRDEIEAINNTKLRNRQKRLIKVMIGLMKSRNMNTIYRFPKWSSICNAAKVEYGRGMKEFERVMRKSGLFDITTNDEALKYGREDGTSYTLNIQHKDDDEIVEIFKDIYEIY